jgi:elongation factor Ts
MSATLSAADVKKLRDMTGAGMMDCKKALEEAGGDFDKAVEVLRKQGQKLSLKRADREAKEGAVIAMTSANRNNGVVIRLGCETDFVAKNEDFVKFAKGIAEIALKHLPADLDGLLALPYDGGISVGEKITEQTGVTGEKMEVSYYAKLETAAGQGQVLPYIHMGNRAGVIVALNLEGPDFIEPGKNVAMQIAAMRPVAVDKDGVSADLIEKEIEIGKEQARQEGKPEAMLEKIAIGKLNKFYQESTLLNQTYVKDGKMTVAEYLKSLDKDLTVTAFKHVELG